MRSTEFIKMMKRKVNQKKELAHRKKVEGKTTNKQGLRSRSVVDQKILDDIQADKTDGFASSHLSLKGKALTGPSAFSKLNKATLHCLFRLYDIVFPARKTKVILCELLQQKILQVDALPYPHRVQAERFARIKENHQNRKEVDDFPDDVSEPNSQAAADPSMQSQPQHAYEMSHSLANANECQAEMAFQPASPNPPCENSGIRAAELNARQSTALHHNENTKQRRARFTTTEEQLSLLKEDHEQQTNKVLNLKRAHDFGVHISQIETWHKRYRKKRRTCPGRSTV